MNGFYKDFSILVYAIAPVLPFTNFSYVFLCQKMPTSTTNSPPLRAHFENISDQRIFPTVVRHAIRAVEREALFVSEENFAPGKFGLKAHFVSLFQTQANQSLCQGLANFALAEFHQRVMLQHRSTICTDTFSPVFATTILAVMSSARAAFTATRFPFSLNLRCLPAAFVFRFAIAFLIVRLGYFRPIYLVSYRLMWWAFAVKPVCPALFIVT